MHTDHIYDYIKKNQYKCKILVEDPITRIE
jgi:hypothetical protein